MKACIILHNMIIEDKRDKPITERCSDYEQEIEIAHTVSREKTSQFMEFI
jgi:hypothetical protein